ncbi:hypothetical protein FB451DRAFT_1486159 [Mycena latifolia]|nr:hypothetical protein FB451DRAFT_1486159 [Mycena latifolia]
MPPRRGGVPAPAQPPAPEESTRTTRRQAAALATNNIPAPPAAGGRVRAALAGGRNTNPPQEDPQPLAPGPGALEPARGFAPLTDRAVAPAASSSRQQTPRTPVRSTTNSPLQFPPQTPGRNAANRLLTQLNHQTQMASPGPPVRNFSDDSSPSSSESDPLPVPRPRRVVRARIQPLTALHTDTEEESAADNRPSRSQVRPTRSRQPPGSQASSQSEGNQSDAWTGYQIDQAKYAWAEDATLKANNVSADCQAFYGQHIEHYGYKCRLCPQVYSSGSSLTTRRKHLGKDHRPQYLQLIADRKLPNKLPEALRKEREEQRARDMQRTPFSIAAFEEKLVQVIVSNDLSINLIENHEFRDLLLLLRESLQDKDIPHRTKLCSLILDAWLKYYDSLKKELKVSAARCKVQF